MIHKAPMVMGYRVRLLIISLMLLLFTAWCAYDGFVAYPEQKELYETYLEVTKDAQLTEKAWVEYAQANDLPTSEPGETTQMDIYTQYIMGGVLLPIGLFMLVVFFITGTKWIGVEEDALVASGGKRATWDSVTDLDESRWKSKGIAVVYFNNKGKPDKITLDDWKYERDATVEILNVVREKTGMGGDAETEQKQEQQANEQIAKEIDGRESQGSEEASTPDASADTDSDKNDKPA